MKKKEKQNNSQKQIAKNVEYLQKKLEEEKQNLVKENKKLQRQIHQQIQENRLMKIEFQKKQAIFDQTLHTLKNENENLRTQILLNQQSIGNDEQNNIQIHLKKSIEACKILTSQNQKLKQNLQQNIQVMTDMEENIKKLERQNAKYKKKNKQQQTQIKKLARQIEQNKQIYDQLQHQFQQTIKQLQKKMEQNKKLQANITQLKRKNKQFSQIVSNLEQKMQILKQKQYAKFEQELNTIKKAKEIVERENMNKQRQIQFFKITINQKDDYIATINSQINNLKGASQLNIKQSNALEHNLQRVENQNRRLLIEIEKQKSRSNKQIEEMRKHHQQQLNKAKRKTAQQISNLLKVSTDSKAIQNYMQGLKYYKSQTNLRGVPLVPLIKSQQQKVNIPFQKYKYENQIMSLNIEVENFKKQMQTLIQQNSRIKKNVEEKKLQLQQKNEKIKHLSLKIGELQNGKNSQQQKLNKQLIRLRNVQTQLMEKQRDFLQLQEATNMKIAYYDKKIKQFLQNIDRKQSIIDNLKNQRGQVQNKQKFMQQKLVKLIEQLDSLRKFKADTQRKDDLMKDYKERTQKYKSQLEHSKLENEKLKKQKTRLQRNLQSKQQYINSLKTKTLKDEAQKEQVLKLEKQNKQLREKYESKLRKLKKQVQDFQQMAQSMKTVVAQKIEEAIKKSSNEPQRNTNWEAAALLGLKSNEIEQFVNPTINLDRHICEDLDQLWQNRKYDEFIRNSIQYLILKSQVQPLQ